MDLYTNMVKMDILLTGASGFLGSAILMQLPSQIKTLDRSVGNIRLDLSKGIPQLSVFNLIIHAAGKAHSVPKTPQQKQEFFDVNVTGTKNLLKGLEQAPALPKAFVFISSVSVYGLDKGENISETHKLNAKDPYGLSKIHAEELVQEWCLKNNVICTILRLPLLVGPNPPGNLGAMIKGIQKGYYMNIAGGKARKSMVLAEDVAKIIPKVAEIGGVYNLTDGYHPSFKELGDYIATQLKKKKPFDVPEWTAKAMAKVGDIIGNKSPFSSYKLAKITADLTFDDSKARKELDWKPRPVLEAFKL